MLTPKVGVALEDGRVVVEGADEVSAEPTSPMAVVFADSPTGWRRWVGGSTCAARGEGTLVRAEILRERPDSH